MSIVDVKQPENYGNQFEKTDVRERIGFNEQGVDSTAGQMQRALANTEVGRFVTGGINKLNETIRSFETPETKMQKLIAELVKPNSMNAKNELVMLFQQNPHLQNSMQTFKITNQLEVINFNKHTGMNVRLNQPIRIKDLADALLVYNNVRTINQGMHPTNLENAQNLVARASDHLSSNSVVGAKIGAIKGETGHGNANINRHVGKQTAINIGNGNKVENTVGQIGGN